MSCYDSRANYVPVGFGYVGGRDSSVGVTPFCPKQASGCQCAQTSKDNCRSCSACGFYQAPSTNIPAEVLPNPCAQGWTEIGLLRGADWSVHVDYQTKSCAKCNVEPFRSMQHCNTCRGDEESGDPLADTIGVPNQYRAMANRPLPAGHHPASVLNPYVRRTMWTNYGIGIEKCIPQCGCRVESGAASGTSNGMRFGEMHSSGALQQSNARNKDPFYFPNVSLLTAPAREYKLYARPTCGSSQWQFAVSPTDTQIPLLTVLAGDPRQPPWSECATVGFNNQAIVQLKSGDRVYVPGQPGTFVVELFMDQLIGPYRPNASVFRGYSPVRPLRGKTSVSNSGLRNFTSHPSANALLRPF